MKLVIGTFEEKRGVKNREKERTEKSRETIKMKK